MSRHLPDDAVLYVHTEQFQVLCRSCWEAGRVNSDRHQEVEHRVVTGKLCAPPGVNAAALREHLDKLVADAGDIQCSSLISPKRPATRPAPMSKRVD